MKVIKPSQLGVLARAYETRRQYRLGISILAFFPLGDERALLPELALWPTAAEQLGEEPVLDVGLPKSRAEYLLAGTAYARGGQATSMTVTATVAGRRKTLRVFGDRYFKAETISEPKPFASMPLDWAHAYGGQQYPKNPLGRGFVENRGDGGAAPWLPNVETAEALIRGPMDRPEPGCFRAIDASWQPRASKAGTYDDAWLREDFPGFTRDMDPSYFNVAPSDQQFDRPFLHDAPYELVNLHPTRAVIAGKLPSVRARCFVNRDAGSFQALEEVTTTLATVWFFPDVERGVLIFQGSVSTCEDDASDVTHLMAGVETWEAGLPLEHYREVITGRCDRKTGHLRVLKDAELCSPELIAQDPVADAMKAEAEGEGLGHKRLQKKLEREVEKGRAVVVALGLDPDVHGPSLQPNDPPPTLEEIPAFLERLEADVDRQKGAARVATAKVDEENAALFAQLGLDYDVVLAEKAQKATGPPTVTVRSQRADLEGVVASFAGQGLPTEHIQAILDDPEPMSIWEMGEKQSREMYRQSAHLQDAAAARGVPESAPLRAKLDADPRRRFAGFDLTGADLSESSFAGADFEGAFLESVDFRGADLRKANLRRAVLAHAHLEGADLTGADLSGANLGSSSLDRANFTECKLEGAVFSKASLRETRFDRAVLKQADFADASFEKTSFAGAVATQTTFLKSVMRGLSFEGATMTSCNFLEVDFTQANFREADVSKSVFLRVRGFGADFTNAKLHNVRCCEAPIFQGAEFSGADLSDGNLRGAVLTGATFRGATLDRADLSRVEARHADFYRASAKDARFVKAELVSAMFVGANLMGASLAGARLEGADLTGSNLFGADLSRMAIDHHTRMTDALTVKTRIHPARHGAGARR